MAGMANASRDPDCPWLQGRAPDGAQNIAYSVRYILPMAARESSIMEGLELQRERSMVP